MEEDAPQIHWLVALLPFAVLVVLQVLVIKQFGSDSIDGASQTALLFSAAVAVAIAMVGYKVPWNTCGMTQSMVLKVSTLEYLPYCFFNLISPLMSITVAFIGYKFSGERKMRKRMRHRALFCSLDNTFEE